MPMVIQVDAVDIRHLRKRYRLFAHSMQQATGNRQQATGNRQQATGNRQQATGNRQQATGKKFLGKK
ncbi:MAG: hypothetical protein F6K23_37775 [Okeania sp. SIO2C9]|uniref:hypothetical protein n=1 Tax=Okeania sp. SIO2C9 TaxID=2607791 RepID=UPI0013BEE86C|nr:hypothetical protein [Okeania sp. SIO2C9]NEQ78238.1 hypothetical protein [Okeania sp. SIO2C9]